MSYVGMSYVGSDRSSSFLSTVALTVLTDNLVKERDHICPAEHPGKIGHAATFSTTPLWLQNRIKAKAAQLGAADAPADAAGDTGSHVHPTSRLVDPRRNRVADKVGNARTKVVQDRAICEYDAYFDQFRSAQHALGEPGAGEASTSQPAAEVMAATLKPGEVPAAGQRSLVKRNVAAVGGVFGAGQPGTYRSSGVFAEFDDEM